ncbi:MAG: TonB-dependent receptor, partial [Syntrophothermus sp.]
MNSNIYKHSRPAAEKIRRIIASGMALLLLMSSGVSVAQSVDISEYDGAMTGSLNAAEELQEEYSATPFSPVLKTALNVRVTVIRRNATLRDCLHALSEMSGIKLLFNDRLVDGLYASMDYEDVTLAAALEMLLADKGLAYREFDKGQIVLFRRNAPAAKSGSVKGTVRDEKNEVLYAASVVVEGTTLGAATGINGDYAIHNVKPGAYRVKASYMGYVPLEKRVIVEEGKTVNVDFVLKPTSFQIGGIEVVGVTDLLPTDVATKTSINSGEIEHFQASSVKDVLALVPGVAKTDNPGLGKTGQIAIRGAEDNNLSALGTLIMVDGIPVSNNANLQFEMNSGAKSGMSNMGAGADLRTIPADNLNSIEVITGLPSVRYGDATEGVINIKTKIGSQPDRLKIKQNPDTEEANFGGGTSLNANNGLSYNLNAARSERDLRLTGDEYTRLTGELVHSNKFNDMNFTMYQKLKGQRIFDEEQPKGDAWKTKNYNRTFSLGYANWGKFVPEGEVSSIEYNLYLD